MLILDLKYIMCIILYLYLLYESFRPETPKAYFKYVCYAPYIGASVVNFERIIITLSYYYYIIITKFVKSISEIIYYYIIITKFVKSNSEKKNLPASRAHSHRALRAPRARDSIVTLRAS